jgi:hypothetical protein
MPLVSDLFVSVDACQLRPAPMQTQNLLRAQEDDSQAAGWVLRPLRFGCQVASVQDYVAMLV